ncbi:MAG: hypothetical protein P8J27_05935 [Mariniblastus sp.]|nr:hypothetical protein [Mariniblastus sp.]
MPSGIWGVAALRLLKLNYHISSTLRPKRELNDPNSQVDPMKILTTLFTLMAFGFGAIAFASENTETSNTAPISVLVGSQDDTPTPVASAQLDGPTDAPTPVVGDSVIQEPMLVQQPILAAPMSDDCCQPRCRRRCRCCTPPPVPTMFCLEDPCGCPHEACIKVPACCAGEQPCITWRQGLLNRQIATLCWESCDHKVKVIVNGRGKVRVRD